MTHPARLNDLMVAVETVLNVHQLLKVVLGQKHETGEEKLQQNKHEARYGISSYPLLHDVVGMVSHFFHYAEGRCTDSKR